MEMDVHTWFNVKTKYSLEKIRSIALECSAREIQFLCEIVNNPKNHFRKSDPEISKMTQQELDWDLKVRIRIHRRIGNKTIKRDFIYIAEEFHDGGEYGFDCVNDIIYSTNDLLPFDLFKLQFPEKVDYENITLSSLEETLAFINDNMYNLIWPRGSKAACIAQIHAFWKEHPVAYIDFG